MRFRPNGWLLNWDRFTLFRVCTRGMIFWLFENCYPLWWYQDRNGRTRNLFTYLDPQPYRHVNNTGMTNRAVVISNLCENRHKWYIAKTRFFGLHFYHRQHKYLQILWHNWPESYRIRWNNAKLRPLRRSVSFKVTDFSTNRKPICLYDFLLVINTDLGVHPISHRLQIIADYWSN